jgi:hypothetical protein
MSNNTACIQIVNNPVNRKFTCHIDVLQYYCRDLVCDRVMTLVKCSGTHNTADTVTKSLPGPAWAKHSLFLLGTSKEYQVFALTLGIPAHCVSQATARAA